VALAIVVVLVVMAVMVVAVSARWWRAGLLQRGDIRRAARDRRLLAFGWR